MDNDKMISAKSILGKLNDRLDNQEDFPPMTIGDFMRMINEEQDMRIPNKKEIWIDKENEAYIVKDITKLNVHYVALVNPHNESSLRIDSFLNVFRKTNFKVEDECFKRI